MPNEPKKHHLVPQFWLRQFSRRNALLRRQRNGVEEPVKVKNATVVPNFYADPTKASPEERQAVELYLSEHVDNALAAQAFKALPARGYVRLDDRLIKLFAFQLVRTRAFRELIAELDRNAWPLFFAQDVLARARREIEITSDEQAQDLFEYFYGQAPAFPGHTDPNTYLRTMLRTVEQLEDQLRARSAKTLLASIPCLLMGDSPVAPIQWNSALGWDGMLPPDADVLIPLSPSRLLVLSTSLQLGNVQPVVTEQLAQASNQRQVDLCQQDIFRSPQMPWPRNLELRQQGFTLPSPRITVRLNPSSLSTFPADFPVPNDEVVGRLIRQLGGVDTAS